MRYVDSVEDRVHQLLSSRLQDIYTLFGQVPDVLEDVWIDVALGQLESAKTGHRGRPKAAPVRHQNISGLKRLTGELRTGVVCGSETGPHYPRDGNGPNGGEARRRHTE